MTDLCRPTPECVAKFSVRMQSLIPLQHLDSLALWMSSCMIDDIEIGEYWSWIAGPADSSTLLDFQLQWTLGLYSYRPRYEKAQPSLTNPRDAWNPGHGSLKVRGVYPPNNLSDIPPILTSSPSLFLPPPPPQTIFGHCVCNFVQFSLVKNYNELPKIIFH